MTRAGSHLGTARLLIPLALLALVCSAAAVQHAARTGTTARPMAHPGVLVNRPQLDRARRRVADRAEPWRSAYAHMRDSRYGSLSWSARPTEVVKCPPDNRPGVGCVEEREDAIAAYTHALLWYVGRDRRHAAKAVEIMDAWSATVREHTEVNAHLQSAWAGSTWARAAEIVRYSGAGWRQPEVRRFEGMLRRVYLPEVGSVAQAPAYNGNWELTMTDAAIGIAVFLDDRAVFDRSVERFHDRVPAYFYLMSDGPLPKLPPGSRMMSPRQLSAYWFRQSSYLASGVSQETCRNFMHVGYALAATAHIAETAWHQGVDLYAGSEARLRAALELHSRYQLGADAPRWLCHGTVARNMGPDLEVALNHLHNRSGRPMPQTRRLAQAQRPAGTDDLFVAWETLTHARNPG